MDQNYRQLLEKNLDFFCQHEEENPGYYGPKIRELSDRLGV